MPGPTSSILVGVPIAAGRRPTRTILTAPQSCETVAAAAITIFLMLVMLEILRNAFNHLSGWTRHARSRRRALS
jgi:hypothetical protein